MNPLVSIITPCYNGEEFVGRFLDSVLNQTYDNIELIIINDGSTDKTEEIIHSYQEKFDSKGYKLIYIYQENAGQSAAINQGLKIFKGEFLTWPDSDDTLTQDSITKKVKFLLENPLYGTVVLTTKIVDETTKEVKGYQRSREEELTKNLFKDLLLNKVYYSCGAYMVRVSMFKKVMPDPLQIECPREVGQNYQMMLPILYHYPCRFIDEIGYVYYLRGASHSHNKLDYERTIEKINIGVNVMTKICNSLSTSTNELINIKRMIYRREVQEKLNAMFKFRRRDHLKEVYKIIDKFELRDKDLNKSIRSIKYPLYYKVYKFLTSIKYRI